MEIEEIKIHLHRTIPTVFDDSMTYLELLYVILGKINEVVTGHMTLQSQIDIIELAKEEIADLTNNRKLSATGDFTGTWNGKHMEETSQGVEAICVDLENNIALINIALDNKINKDDIANIVSGSPTFVTDLNDMTDSKKAYCYLTDGYIYLYNSNTSSFEKTNVQYQPQGIAPQGVTHVNIKKNAIVNDNLGYENMLKDIIDYTPFTTLLPSGYIMCPNVVLQAGEVQLEVKTGITATAYIYLFEKNDNILTVKNSMTMTFAVGVTTINTNFIADGNGKEYVGIYGLIYANSNDVSTGYYFSSTTSQPTNTTFTANTLSTSHTNLAIKVKMLAPINTNNIKDKQITQSKLGDDVITRLNNVDANFLYNNDTPKIVDLNTTNSQTSATTAGHPATIGRLWANYTPITSQGTLSINIKSARAISEYIVLLKKTNNNTYDVVKNQLVNLVVGINTIVTALTIDDDGIYYVGVTDRLTNSSDGTKGNMYTASSTGNYVIEIFDFDISSRTACNTAGTDGTLLTNYLLGLQVTVKQTLKESITSLKTFNNNNTDVPPPIIYTEKFLGSVKPTPPYGTWTEVGTAGTFNNNYTPVASANFSNYFYLNYVTNFDTDAVKWRIQLTDTTSKFRLARVSYLSIKTTTVEYDNGIIRLYGVSQQFGFSTISSVLSNKTLTMPIVANRDYIFTLENYGFIVMFTITDTITNVSEKIEYDSTNQASAGLCMDYPLISLASGNITVKQFDYYSKYLRNPKIIIIGDSVVEGITIKDDGGWLARWAYKINQNIEGQCAIIAAGGESTVSFMPKLEILKRKFYRPEYVFLELMSNDTNFDSWRINTEIIIDWILSVGATPVFCMLPKTIMDINFFNSVLSYVNTSPYKVIDFYKCMTINGDGVTVDQTLYNSDLTHPNQAGHLKMYNHVVAVLPEIFPVNY